RHELDWIVMKALEKDRTRRYETANDFARDVRRYLDDEPVEACPPSRLYRWSKFARRNKTTVISAVAVLLSLMTALVAVALNSVSRRELADRQQELTAQQLQVQQGINDALAEVAGLRSRASTAEGSDEADLTAAREKLQLAVGLAESGPIDPTLVAQVRTLEQELDNEVAERAQDRRDDELLVALKEAWLLQANLNVRESRFAKEDSVPLLRKALQDYGITVVESRPDDAAAVIASRPQEMQQHIVAALEELRELARPIIGITLQTANAATVITGIAPDGPAARDGRLREGDTLVGIGEGREGEIVSTRSLAGPAVTDRLRGESGTTVRLEVIPKGETESRVYEIQRDPTAAWLKAVVEIADSDPWRGRLREAWQLDDQEQRQTALEDLAEQVDVRKQPVRVLTRLAEQLVAIGVRDRATGLLRRVQKTYPSDLWANASLADVLRDSRPPHLEEAIRYYTAAIALRPDSAGLHLNLGSLLGDQGELEEANAEYRESLRITPFYAQPRCNLVNNLIKLGKLEEAEAVAREAVRLWPQSAAFHANLGNALRKLQKDEEAAAVYREALRLNPEMAGTNTAIAMDLFGAGQHEMALAKFREIIQMDPTLAESHFNLGRALYLLGRMDEASEAYRACLKLDPNAVPALTNLIIILSNQGRAEEAAAVCREVIERAPDASNVQNAWNSLACCLMECGYREEAIAASRESIRLYPRSFLTYTNLARFLVDPSDPTLRQPQEAVELAVKAVELEPQEEMAWYVLGIARFRNEEWQPSIEAFQKSESFVDVRKYGTLYAVDTHTWANKSFYRAMAFWQLGQPDEAHAWFLVGENQMRRNGPERDLDCLQEAAKLLGMSLDEARTSQELIAAYRTTLTTQPDGAMRHNELAWLLATAPDPQSREPEQGVQHALQAVQSMPQEAGLWNTLGVAHYRNGQWPAAVEALQKSMDLSGGGTTYDWLLMAMAHRQLDQKDAAQKWYDKAAASMKDPAAEIPDEDLTRLRTEADQLLGTEKAKSEPPSVSEPPVSTDRAAEPHAPVENVPAIPPQDP
ncbi:MAG: tetratricopeptide repeat protein, partial [Pirellulaceae bacterium]